MNYLKIKKLLKIDEDHEVKYLPKNSLSYGTNFEINGNHYVAFNNPADLKDRIYNKTTNTLEYEGPEGSFE